MLYILNWRYSRYCGAVTQLLRQLVAGPEAALPLIAVRLSRFKELADVGSLLTPHRPAAPHRRVFYCCARQ